jgi:hypothetical protein
VLRCQELLLVANSRLRRRTSESDQASYLVDSLARGKTTVNFERALAGIDGQVEPQLSLVDGGPAEQCDAVQLFDLAVITSIRGRKPTTMRCGSESPCSKAALDLPSAINSP